MKNGLWCWWCWSKRLEYWLGEAMRTDPDGLCGTCARRAEAVAGKNALAAFDYFYEGAWHGAAGESYSQGIGGNPWDTIVHDEMHGVNDFHRAPFGFQMVHRGRAIHAEWCGE